MRGSRKQPPLGTLGKRAVLAAGRGARAHGAVPCRGGLLRLREVAGA